mmetsp:Transcript_30482/g.58426  ORF Transcript_30482/g.58426 Transcript_30482/m.58426 type:complete len:87 (+) Transcript_30482:705-965(+)
MHKANEIDTAQYPAANIVVKLLSKYHNTQNDDVAVDSETRGLIQWSSHGTGTVAERNAVNGSSNIVANFSISDVSCPTRSFQKTRD